MAITLAWADRRSCLTDSVKMDVGALVSPEFKVAVRLITICSRSRCQHTSASRHDGDSRSVVSLEMKGAFLAVGSHTGFPIT